MERIAKGEVITLEDNNEYIVLDVVELEGRRYLYLVDEKSQKVIVAEEIIEGNDIIIETLDDQKRIEEIVKIVIERLRN
jgi:hypothetical protein